MNFIDPILAIVILIYGLLGYQKGFINSFSGLIKWLGAFIIALSFYSLTSVFIKQNFAVADQWLLPLSFLVVFIVSLFPLAMFVSFFKKAFDTSLQKNMVNRVAGIIPGMATGIIATAFIAHLLAFSLWIPIANETKNSLIFKSIDQSSTSLNTELTRIFNRVVEQKISGAFEGSAVINETEEFKCSNFFERTDLQEQLLQLVNSERIKHRVNPVIADPDIQKVANEHATDMFTRGYFSHDTPEGTDPFDRMKKSGISFRFAGENLAHSSSLVSAHKGLMQSPGHRANILNPNFGRLGISVLDGGSKGLMLVEEFRD